MASSQARRRFLKTATLLSGSAVFSRALFSLAEGEAAVTTDLVKQAEWVSGLSFTDAERQLMLNDLNDIVSGTKKLREVALDNSVPPAFLWRPLVPPPALQAGTAMDRPKKKAPQLTSAEDIAFASAADLALLLQAKKISSVELTRLYLDRIKRFDPVLSAVITPTEDLALKLAQAADSELAKGKTRSPLHGIPWGAKDLIAVPGYKTTWGSVPFKDQVRPEKATVAARLEAAGAVLVAKTAVGELAWGDVWFGGTTKNPWKKDQGSSGSSAGSASGTAAALYGFAIGTETWGSIVSPSTRCGTTGLRPTFGRVSRHGVMALSWTMDKLGPIARSAEDCALVFAAIHGPDPADPWAQAAPFNFRGPASLKGMKIGFVPEYFDADRAKDAKTPEEKQASLDWMKNDRQVLEVLKSLGAQLVPLTMPEKLPISALAQILTAEAATCFDGLTRSGRLKEMVRQVEDAWPNVFRQGQLIPAVSYLRAMRVRTLLMQELEKSLGDIRTYVVPSYGGNHLLMTNLTGHPAVVLPNGFRSGDKTPTSITFMGRLWADDEVLAVAAAYQQATDFHKKRPPLPG
jgi:Asp-tRNA(Asn)/Glu-tRNA(Gln) amidotransferase A subunit family amidase